MLMQAPGSHHGRHASLADSVRSGGSPWSGGDDGSGRGGAWAVDSPPAHASGGVFGAALDSTAVQYFNALVAARAFLMHLPRVMVLLLYHLLKSRSLSARHVLSMPIKIKGCCTCPAAAVAPFRLPPIYHVPVPGWTSY
jgi:hypothetical protein